MSASDASRSTDPPTKPARARMFEVRDDKPEPEPPQLLRRKIDPFEDPSEVRRRRERASGVTTARPPRPLDLISVEPELLESRIQSPMVETADLQRARLLSSRAYDRRPSRHLPAPSASVFDPIRDHPWLLAVICAVSIAIIALASPASQQRQLIISSGGRSLATSLLRPAAEQPPVVISVPPGEHLLIGEPTINAEMVDAVLAKYNSPAVGTGRVWIELGQQYGIDPAYPLAFFIHESTAGTNPGWAGLKPGGGSTHNVGNIICAGYSTCFGRFRDYTSWEEGIEDWFQLIKREYIERREIYTVEQIVPIYAPHHENNVPQYINVVVGLVTDWRQGVR